jgi:hypothetical protein
MEDIKMLFQYTIHYLNRMCIKYEFTEFPSGAIMLDIWSKEKFFVIQFEDCIGVSEITENNISFDTNPDERFCDVSKYKQKLESMFLE